MVNRRIERILKLIYETKGHSDYAIVDPPEEALTARVIDVNNPPRVSFCIPTLNNEDTIEHCLVSIKNQNYPGIEIVIVDGYSKDRTVEIARRFTRDVYFEAGTLGSARQESIDHSTGEIIALFDGDIIIPHGNWLQDAVKYFNYSPSVGTVWPFNIPPPNASVTALVHADHSMMIFKDRIMRNLGVIGGGNALFLRKCLEDIGGVDRTFRWGEDFDWAKRMRNKDYKVVVTKDVLHHNTHRSFGEFVRKEFKGASTFIANGTEVMNLSTGEALYEYVVLGTAGMMRRVVLQGDLAWMMFPLMTFVRSVAFSWATFKNALASK